MGPSRRMFHEFRWIRRLCISGDNGGKDLDSKPWQSEREGLESGRKSFIQLKAPCFFPLPASVTLSMQWASWAKSQRDRASFSGDFQLLGGRRYAQRKPSMLTGAWAVASESWGWGPRLIQDTEGKEARTGLTIPALLFTGFFSPLWNSLSPFFLFNPLSLPSFLPLPSSYLFLSFSLSLYHLLTSTD